MVHRIVCVTLVIVAIVGTVAAQNRHDDRPLLERAASLEPFILSAARRYGVDARILRAICFTESGFRIGVISPKGARGPMQLMPATAARYGVRDPNNPEQTIDAAARYVRDLLSKFGGRIDLAVAAYNAGEGAVSSFLTGKPLVLRDGRIVNARGVVTGGVPPYLETQLYVRSILTLLNNSRIRRIDGLNVGLKLDARRDLSFDKAHLPERDQKFLYKRPSSFIYVDN